MTTIKRDIFVTILLYSFALIYTLYFSKSKETNENTLLNKIKKIHKSCLYHCKTEKCKNIVDKNRGKNYFPVVKQEDQKHIRSCLVTFWSLLHFSFYFILGYFVPSFYYIFIIIGITYEIIEYYYCSCDDPLDILFNTSGVLLGRYFSPY